MTELTLFLQSWYEPACNSTIELYKSDTHFYIKYHQNSEYIDHQTIVKRNKDALETIQKILDKMKEDLANE